MARLLALCLLAAGGAAFNLQPAKKRGDAPSEPREPAKELGDPPRKRSVLAGAVAHFQGAVCHVSGQESNGTLMHHLASFAQRLVDKGVVKCPEPLPEQRRELLTRAEAKIRKRCRKRAKVENKIEKAVARLPKKAKKLEKLMEKLAKLLEKGATDEACVPPCTGSRRLEVGCPCTPGDACAAGATCRVSSDTDCTLDFLAANPGPCKEHKPITREYTCVIDDASCDSPCRAAPGRTSSKPDPSCDAECDEYRSCDERRCDGDCAATHSCDTNACLCDDATSCDECNSNGDPNYLGSGCDAVCETGNCIVSAPHPVLNFHAS